MDAADQPAAGARPDLGTPARNELRDRLLRAGAFQIAEAYEGAVAVLNQPALPSRHHLLAHLVRDIAVDGSCYSRSGRSRVCLPPPNLTPLQRDVLREFMRRGGNPFFLSAGGSNYAELEAYRRDLIARLARLAFPR